MNKNSSKIENVKFIAIDLSFLPLDVINAPLVQLILDYASLVEMRDNVSDAITELLASDNWPKEPRVHFPGHVFDSGPYHAAMTFGFSSVPALESFFQDQAVFIRRLVEAGDFRFGENAIEQMGRDLEEMRNELEYQLRAYYEHELVLAFGELSERHHLLSGEIAKVCKEICARPCRNLLDIKRKIEFAEKHIRPSEGWTKRLIWIIDSMKAAAESEPPRAKKSRQL